VACGDAARITMGRILIWTIDSRPPWGQPACLERGSFLDGSMHGGSQPTDISLIHRRSSRLVSHHPRPLAATAKPDRQAPPLTPPQGGQSSPPDGLGGPGAQSPAWPKPYRVRENRPASRVRFAGLRPPLTRAGSPKNRVRLTRATISVPRCKAAVQSPPDKTKARWPDLDSEEESAAGSPSKGLEKPLESQQIQQATRTR